MQAPLLGNGDLGSVSNESKLMVLTEIVVETPAERDCRLAGSRVKVGPIGRDGLAVSNRRTRRTRVPITWFPGTTIDAGSAICLFDTSRRLPSASLRLIRRCGAMIEANRSGRSHADRAICAEFRPTIQRLVIVVSWLTGAGKASAAT
jgi:hypothetical protein